MIGGLIATLRVELAQPRVATVAPSVFRRFVLIALVTSATLRIHLKTPLIERDLHPAIYTHWPVFWVLHVSHKGLPNKTLQGEGVARFL